MKCLKVPQVARIIKKDPSSVYEAMRKGTFPRLVTVCEYTGRTSCMIPAEQMIQMWRQEGEIKKREALEILAQAKQMEDIIYGKRTN